MASSDPSSLYNILLALTQNGQNSSANGAASRASLNTSLSPAPGPSNAPAPIPPNPQASISSGPNPRANANQLQVLLSQLVIPQGSTSTSQTGLMTASLQSFLNEALKISNPVGNCPDDDARLARALYESENNGQTFRQALEALNDVNGHSTMQWRDYYLDHGSRIHKLMNKLAAPQVVSQALPRPQTHLVSPPTTVASTPAGRPSVSMSQDKEHRDEHPVFPPPIPRSTQPTATISRPVSQSASSRLVDRGRALERPKPSSSSRHRERDLSYSPECPAKNPRPLRRHQSDEDWNLHPNSAEIRLPPRPSRAPTPPTLVVIAKNGLGTKFTEEDKKFFVDFILWEVGKDGSLSKSEVQNRLAQQAPHHDASSWGGYWTRNSDLADKVYHTARAISGKAAPQSQSRPRARRRSLNHPRLSDGDEASAGSGSGESDGELSDWESDPHTEADTANMGGHNELWSRADLRIMSRWIAKQPSYWKRLPRKDKYTGYIKKYGNKRTTEGCHYTYQKNKSTINRMVRQYSVYLERKKAPRVMKTERVEISLLSEDEKEDLILNTSTKRKADDGGRLPSSENAEKRRKTSLGG
ncbi:uncharacterized protein B0H18DRAFT_968928 [Fomitopsis serialis]|uniref:uncharacterized protein n=1 Tax=Fomitopsis serialis TaxID=139415 RepID=UPI002007D502|nr:uncharacterized protein B0H18DRAFT_968928 [Neoantrodia serialis]KAH9937055.1 hypothetical protein B0H18DRAFT_968928 [Neoantrodia serialis]